MAKRKATAIYALLDPRTGLVRYIGKTRNPAKRMEGHVSPGRHSRTPVAKWSRMLRGEGLRPEMMVLEWVDDWQSAERGWIQHGRDEGVSLLNVAKGGLDMAHIVEHRGRYPAYNWVMRWCGRTQRDDLARAIKAKASEVREAHGAAGMEGYDRYLRSLVLSATPLAGVP